MKKNTNIAYFLPRLVEARWKHENTAINKIKKSLVLLEITGKETENSENHFYEVTIFEIFHFFTYENAHFGNTTNNNLKE